MKLRIFAVLLFVFAAQVSIFAQSEKELAAVRVEVKSINDNLRKLKKETKNVSGLSLEGAEATYYLAKTEIRKITAAIYGETYRSAVEVYYRGGAPIFIYSKTSKYDAPISPNKLTKIISSEERRSYYADGKTVRIIVGKAVLKASDNRYTEIENSLNELARNLVKSYSAEE